METIFFTGIVCIILIVIAVTDARQKKIPNILLGALCVAAIFSAVVYPYMDATLAEFYVAIRTESIAKGLVVEGELPGYSVQNV